MIHQTAAIFLDAYRELNSKRMFWIVLILSCLAIAAFAMLGVRGRNLMFLGWSFPEWWGMGTAIYKYIYLYTMVGIWLTFGATILALISTASIFPDFIAGGSIEIFLPRPISRLRLFLTKFLAGLTFAFLQILIFAVPSYFILGIRGGVWEPGIFWAIPIELCFFSYLYACCVLFGVWTRSTVASILLTIVVWFFLWAVQWVAVATFQGDLLLSEEIAAQQRTIEQADRTLASLTRPSDETGQVMTSPSIIDNQREQRAMATAERDLQMKLRWWARVGHALCEYVMIPLPKTTATNNLLDRHMMTDADVRALLSPEPMPQPHVRSNHHQQKKQAELITQEELRARSPSWIIGTSLAFEFVVVSLAAWMFCRRDY